MADRNPHVYFDIDGSLLHQPPEAGLGLKFRQPSFQLFFLLTSVSWLLSSARHSSLLTRHCFRGGWLGRISTRLIMIRGSVRSKSKTA